MPYFAIQETVDKVDVCVGKAERIEDVDYYDFLGARKKWEIREIDAVAARILLSDLRPEMSAEELDKIFGTLVRVVSMPLSYTDF